MIDPTPTLLFTPRNRTNNGWVAWRAETPTGDRVAPPCGPVDVQFRDGSQWHRRDPNSLNWNQNGEGNDIVIWRPAVVPATPPPARDTIDRLRPQGCPLGWSVWYDEGERPSENYVDVEFREGDRDFSREPSTLQWRHNGGPRDIVLFRPAVVIPVDAATPPARDPERLRNLTAIACSLIRVSGKATPAGLAQTAATILEELEKA